MGTGLAGQTTLFHTHSLSSSWHMFGSTVYYIKGTHLIRTLSIVLAIILRSVHNYSWDEGAFFIGTLCADPRVHVHKWRSSTSCATNTVWYQTQACELHYVAIFTHLSIDELFAPPSKKSLHHMTPSFCPLMHCFTLPFCSSTKCERESTPC